MCAQGEVELEGLGQGPDCCLKGILVKFILGAGTTFL